ncbi:MAG: hypothetical protein QW303_01530, partial [Nitrososphaerota archaeon]
EPFSSLNTQLEQKTKENEELIRTIKQLTESFNKLQKENFKKSELIEKQQKEIETYQKQISELEMKNQILEQTNFKLEELTKTLVNRISALETENNTLKNDVQRLKISNQLHDALLISSDVADLYYFYFCEKHLGKWGTFSKELLTKRAQLEDKEISQEEFTKWLAPKESLVGINLVLFQDLMRKRNKEVHNDTCSAAAQAKLIQELSNSDLPDEFEFKSVVKFMVTQLASTKLRRKC